MDLFVARQPIFDLGGQIAGYELLYRHNAEALEAEPGNAMQMSSDVIVQSIVEVGLDRLTTGTRGFVNFGREMLVSGAYEVLDPRSVVIELLEDVRADAEVLRACAALRESGFCLALDDFEVGGSQTELLEFASILKLDVLFRTPDEVEQIARTLRPHGITLLAERVETEEVYEATRCAGFSLFQGYYFRKPETVASSGRTIDAMRLIPLMNALLADSVTDAEVAGEFQQDPDLSYKLLRIVSSATYGQRGVQSIQHAIQMIGRRALHRWVTILLASSLAGSGGYVQELVHGTLVRARFLELLAAEARMDSGALVLVGLFSNMDTLLQMPMPELLERVTLADDVRAALERRAGAAYLPWIELAEAYELGAWKTVDQRAGALGVSRDQLGRHYPEAVAWATLTLGYEQPAA
jgi:c-di-GMP phosphodiesterase